MGRVQEGALWTAVGCWALGGVVVLSGAGLIPWGERAGGPPPWLTVVVGLVVVMTGVLLSFVAVGSSGHSLLYAGLVSVTLTLLTLPFAWVALGPGRRGFDSPTALGLLWPGAGEIEGRAAFGLATLLLAAVTFAAWRAFYRRLRAAGREGKGSGTTKQSGGGSWRPSRGGR